MEISRTSHCCYTAEEIGAEVGLTKDGVEKEVSLISLELNKIGKVTFSEPDYAPPIYQLQRPWIRSSRR